MKKHIHVFWLLVSWLAFQSFFLFVNGWFTHDSKPGNFRVGFPGQPTEYFTGFQYGNSTFNSICTFCKQDSSVFQITWFDHPFHSSNELSYEKLNQALDTAQSYFYHSQHLSLNEIKEINLGGSDFLGREYKYTCKDSSLFICNRVFLVNNRFYILSTSEQSTTNNVSSSAAKFLNSFTFLDVRLIPAQKKK